MRLTGSINGYLLFGSANGLSPTTLETNRYHLLKMVNILGDKLLRELSPDDITEFFVEIRSRDYSESTICRIWSALRAFFNWVEAELELASPMQHIAMPRFVSPEVKPLTEDDVVGLLKACKYSSPSIRGSRLPFRMHRPTAARDTAILLTLLDTGLRVSEFCRLQAGDLNLETGELLVRPYRNSRKSRSRTVYLGCTARKAIWNYLRFREGRDALFLTTDERPLQRRAVHQLVSRLGKRAGIAGVHPHRFRHTFAIQFLRNGGDVFTLQRIIGHSTLEMVKKYLALADADAAAAHKRASPADRWRL